MADSKYSYLENKNKKGYLRRCDKTSNESYDVSRRHERPPERLLVLLSNSRYRRDVGCIARVVPVCIVVARMACAEECAHTQEGGEDGVHQAN